MILSWGQILLISSLVFLVIYIFKIRSELMDRLAIVLGSVIGACLIIDPRLATFIANQIGFGRGTDLLLYFYIITSLFLFITFAVSLHKYDRKITHIVRMLAIDQAKKGEHVD